MKIGIIGDLHLKDKLGYCDYVADSRTQEKKEVLDAIINNLSDCETIVLMGDNFNNRNNSSETIKEMVEFLSRFSGKKLYLLAGNHEKAGDGKSAIDFLKSLKNKNWEVITNTIEAYQIGKYQSIMLPFITRAELGKKDNDEALKSIMKSLPKADILFTHFSVSGAETGSNFFTDYFNEIVLPLADLNKKYNHIIGGHIHKPQQVGKLLVTGSIFNNEIGEQGKYVYKLDDETDEITSFLLPGRGIYRLENPSLSDLNKIAYNNIVKVILTDKKIAVEPISEALKQYDAYLLLEQYPNQRTKVNFDEKQAFDFSIERLIIMYSQAKKVDVNKLNHAMELIK